MKNIITLFIVITSYFVTNAQSPEKFSFQAVVVDNANNPITNQSVGLRISLLEDSLTGIVAYQETHTSTTTSNALISIEIGNGITTDNFTSLDWGSYSYYVKTEFDIDNNGTYDLENTAQLLSVPYALHAKTVDSVNNVSGVNTGDQDLSSFLTAEVDGSVTNEIELPTTASVGDMVYWDGNAWQLISGGTEGAFLQFTSGVPKWVVQPSKVGDVKDGGIVFWVDATGYSGLIVDLNDLTSATWGCDGTDVPGTEGTAITTGHSNTSNILRYCTTTNIAADLCNKSNNGGFSDWFLPTKDEFDQLANNINIVNNKLTENGGTALPTSGGSDNYYWTSRSYPNGNSHAMGYRIDVVSQVTLSRGRLSKVRAIRSF